MVHNLTTGMLAATKAATVHPIFFVEVDTPAGNVYFWSGFGNFLWNGIVWIGGGTLMEISPISEINKVQASGTTITMSGCNRALVALALENIQRYQPGKIWVGAIDELYQLITSPFLILNGRIDSVSVNQTGKDASITVSIESRLVTMRLPRFRRYTDLDQRLEHPGDAGFSFVDTIQDATINFHG